MSTLFDNLIDGSTQLYFDDLNSAPSGVDVPAITSIGPLRFQGSATIVGTNFGASQGTGGVTIGGVSQAVLSWSDTSITIGPIARGNLLYGAQAVVVASDADGSSSPSSQPLLPQTGWNYVTLANPLATSGDRITSTPDLAAGDQLAWGNVAPSGTVAVASDASFVAGTGVGSFSVESNDGTGWSGFGTQTMGAVEAFSGTLTSGLASIAGAFNVIVPVPPVNEFPFSGSLISGSATMAGTFLAFTSKAFDGALVAGDASIQGSFSVIGAVVNPPAPPTPTPGTGTEAGKVSIVNSALVKLGAATIKSFNDNSKQARLAGAVFDSVRDREIARHIWKFALFRRNMPEVVSDEPRGGYRYSYTKPVDWLQTVWIGDLTLGSPEAASRTWEADWSHEGEYILANTAPPLPLQYMRRVTDSTKFHVLFADALACRLAMEMCEALTSSTSKWEKARAEYRDAIADARRANAILDPPRTLPSDSWLDARN